MSECYINEDKIIYRRPVTNYLEDEYYTPKLSITKSGGLQINVGGNCIALEIEKWFDLGKKHLNQKASML